MQGVVRVFTAAACALSLILVCATGAQADVVAQSSASGSSASGTTVTTSATVPAGSGRLLVVTVSTLENATVTGVSFGGQPLTNRAAQASGAAAGAGARVELWTLSVPATGTATVTVTLNSSAPAVIGAVAYTGVDALDPLFPVASGGDYSSVNSAARVLNGTTAADGMVGVLALGNVDNTSNIRTQGSVDTVVADVRYTTLAGAIRGAGATRTGNTGQNMAVNAGIVWRWDRIDGNALNPHAQILAGLRSGSDAVAPTVTTADATAVGETTATLGGDVTADGGGALTARGVVVCAGACTPTVGAAGSTAFPAAGAAVGAFTVDATGLASATGYTARAYATNLAGTSYGAPVAFTTLTPNRAPTADAGGPYAIDEGHGLQPSAAGSSDLDGDTLDYAWDLDGDGQYDDATGVSPTIDAATAAALGLEDGPATHTIGVRVSDGSLSSVDTATLTVDDVAPTATFADDGPLPEGGTAHVAFTGATDPSTADTTAGLRYSYDVGDDGSWDVGGGTYATGVTADSTTVPSAYTDDDGTFDVRARVTDKDGGFTSYRTTVTVTAVAPTATIADDGPVVEGTDAHVTFTGATDPSPTDTAAGFRYAYDIGDDGTWELGDGTYGGSVSDTAITVPTDDDGPIVVRATVLDEDGAASTATTTITVDNAPPTATLTAPADTPIDSALTFGLAAADPSPVDAAGAFDYAIDWGDGTQDTVNGPALATATHTFTAAGTYTVSVVATDKDGGAGAPATATVTIKAATTTPPPSGGGGGGGTPGGGAVTTPTPAPVVGVSTSPAPPGTITGLAVAPRCVKASSATTRSVKLRYKLSGAATARVTLQRAARGKAVKQCPPLRGSQQDDGTYKPGSYVPVSSQQTGATSIVIAKGTKNGAVGTVASLRPTALLAKGTKLKAGTYLITVTPLGADGKPNGTVARVKFWVLKG